MSGPLMPKATAVWLLDNTALTFDQIAIFCGLHLLEVQALADGDIYIVGIDPVATGQLTLEEIEKGILDPAYRLQLFQHHKVRRPKGPKYTPLNKRQDKPDAVAWLVTHYPELRDSQIINLVGTTKATIEKIRKRQHVDIKNIKPQSPVDLGICLEEDLARALETSKKKEKAPPKPKKLAAAKPKAKPAPKAKKEGSSPTPSKKPEAKKAKTTARPKKGEGEKAQTVIKKAVIKKKAKK